MRGQKKNILYLTDACHSGSSGMRYSLVPSLKSAAFNILNGLLVGLMQPLLRYPGCIFCICSHSFLTNVIIQDYIPICTFFLKVHSGDPQKLFLQIKKNVPRHIRAPRAVACDNLHLRASAHLRHAVPFRLTGSSIGSSG